MESNKELDIARFIVEKTNRNLFLTGKAGTGKTTFLRDVKRHTKKKYVVLAPTGVAAVNAGAMTIHSFFQFGFGPYVKGVSEPEPNFNIRKNKLEMIRSLELMIIDEISMVRADLMDHINDELQRIRKNNSPFGGVQVVMIGDLQQLPPVTTNVEGELLNRYYDSMYFFDSKILRNSVYNCIELKSVYRQSEQHFIEILNRARMGSLTDYDIMELNARYVPSFRPTNNENYIRLVTHNRQADEINANELAALNSESYTFDAKVSSGFNSDAYPTSRNLELKKGAQVMFIKNDPDKKYVNGSMGVVESVSEDGIQVCLSSNGNIVDVAQMTWEDIRYKLNEESKNIEAEVKGTFKQYPLKTAWAITIHKSQGLTFDRAMIDVSSAFAHGQAYVALSRCRSLQGVILSAPVTNSVFITDSLIQDYLDRTVQESDALANALNFEYFDYDRSADVIIEKTAKTQKESDVSLNPNVFEALRKWRIGIAVEKKVLAYVIFSDKTLINISNALPSTKEELIDIKGIGETRVNQYGDDILAVLSASITDDNEQFIDPEESKTSTKSSSEKTLPENAGLRWAADESVTLLNEFMSGLGLSEIASKHMRTRGAIRGHLRKIFMENFGLDQDEAEKLVKRDVLISERFDSEIVNRAIEDIRNSGQINSSSIDMPQKAKRISVDAEKKVPTYQISYDLYKAGMSVKEIAEHRQLAESTILGHLSQYVVSGEFDIHEFVNDDVIERIREYKLSVPEIKALKDVRLYMGEEVDYGTIRMTLDYLATQEG